MGVIEAIKAGTWETLATLLSTLLSVAAIYCISYIRRAREALETRTNAEILDRTIARAAALAESTVLAIESTTAKALRELVKNGLADREELVALGRQAVDDILMHLGSEGRAVLEATVGDVRDYIQDLVEAQVERLKQYAINAGGSLVPNSLDPAAS